MSTKMQFSNLNKSCAICNSQVKNLESHLLNAHNIKIEVKVLNFGNPLQFYTWKEDMERKTKSRYVKHYGSKKKKDGRLVTYYYCHRDGSYKPRGKNKRSLKSIGSNKINGNCPSLIKVEQDNENLNVFFVATHVGHTCDIGRMVLTTSEKNRIAAKVNSKIPLNHILEEVRNSRIGENVDRIHLTSKQDIRNIIAQYRLESVETSNVNICSKNDVEFQSDQESESSCIINDITTGKEVKGLELDKQHLKEEIYEVIDSIETETEILVAEKFLRSYKMILKAIRSSEEFEGDFSSPTEPLRVSPNKQIIPQTNVIFFSTKKKLQNHFINLKI